jgi:hypothetical protein
LTKEKKKMFRVQLQILFIVLSGRKLKFKYYYVYTHVVVVVVVVLRFLLLSIFRAYPESIGHTLPGCLFILNIQNNSALIIISPLIRPLYTHRNTGFYYLKIVCIFSGTATLLFFNLLLRGEKKTNNSTTRNVVGPPAIKMSNAQQKFRSMFDLKTRKNSAMIENQMILKNVSIPPHFSERNHICNYTERERQLADGNSRRSLHPSRRVPFRQHIRTALDIWWCVTSLKTR